MTPSYYGAIWSDIDYLDMHTKTLSWIMKKDSCSLVPVCNITSRLTNIVRFVNYSELHSTKLTALPSGFPEITLPGPHTFTHKPSTTRLASWSLDGDAGYRYEISLSDTWMEKLGDKGSLKAKPYEWEGLWETAPTQPAHYGVFLKCAAPNNKGEQTKYEVFFATPVPVDVKKILLARKRKHVTLLLTQKCYPAAHCGFRTHAYVHDVECFPKFPKQAAQALVTFSGLQMTEEEKYIARSRETPHVPPNIGLKDTLLTFLQTSQELYHLVTQEQGCVAAAFGHGVRMDITSGVPFADVSICFLEHSFVHDVAPKLLSYGNRFSNIAVSQAELDLLRIYTDTHHLCLKDTAPAHPNLPSWARKYFKRVLMPPLLLTPAAVHAMGKPSDDSADSAGSLKAKGNEYVKSKQYWLAMSCYQKALVRCHARRSAESDEVAVACLSNIAHCCLQVPDEGSYDEAINVCESGLVTIAARKDAKLEKRMKYKLHYRMALAYEKKGLEGEAREKAREQIQAAKAEAEKHGQVDAAINDAYARIMA